MKQGEKDSCEMKRLKIKGRTRCGRGKGECTYKMRRGQYLCSMFSLPSAEKKSTAVYISPSPVCWPMMFRGQTPSSATGVSHWHTACSSTPWLLYLWGREGQMMKSNIFVLWFQWHAGENTEQGCIKLSVCFQMFPLIKDSHTQTHTHYMDDSTMCHTEHKMSCRDVASWRIQFCTHMEAFITDCDYSNLTHVTDWLHFWKL